MSRYHITLKSNYDEPEVDMDTQRSSQPTSQTAQNGSPAPPGTKLLPAPPQHHEGRRNSSGTTSNFDDEDTSMNHHKGGAAAASRKVDEGSERGSYEEGYHTDPDMDPEDDSDGEIVPSHPSQSVTADKQKSSRSYKAGAGSSRKFNNSLKDSSNSISEIEPVKKEILPPARKEKELSP